MEAPDILALAVLSVLLIALAISIFFNRNSQSVEEDTCPKCESPIAYVEIEWNMGFYRWACFHCNWIADE